MNGIPTTNDHDMNDYRLTGRDFVSLDWGYGDDSSDYDSESDSESEETDIEPIIRKKKKVQEKKKEEEKP